MTYIGIDPGAKGAMAVLWGPRTEAGEAISIVPFDRDLYLGVLRGLKASGKDCVCCIEDVHSMPKQGVASTFALGKSYGWLLGVLDAVEIPYQPIPPQRWKKEFGLSSDKTKSIEVCKRLFPNVDLHRTARSRKDDDGMAEALLMALYAKRKF